MWPITVGRGEAGIESRREGLTQNQGWDLGSAAETPETCLELCFNSSLGLQGVSPPTFLDLDVESHCSRGGTGRNESVVGKGGAQRGGAGWNGQERTERKDPEGRDPLNFRRAFFPKVPVSASDPGSVSLL